MMAVKKAKQRIKSNTHTAAEWKELIAYRDKLIKENADLCQANQYLGARLTSVFGVRDPDDIRGSFSTAGIQPGYVSDESKLKRELELRLRLLKTKASNLCMTGYVQIERDDYEIAQLLPAALDSPQEQKELRERNKQLVKNAKACGQEFDFSQFFDSERY